MSYTVRKARDMDQHLFAHLEVRDDELRELSALNLSPVQALLDGYRTSEECWLGFDELCLVAVFGYVREEHAVVPWMLTADIERPVEFLKLSRGLFAGWSFDKPLHNIVGRHNTKSIRWLRALGFTVGSQPIYEASDVAFLPFWKMPEGE